MTLSPYHRAQYTIVQHAYRIAAEVTQRNKAAVLHNAWIEDHNKGVERRSRAAARRGAPLAEILQINAEALGKEHKVKASASRPKKVQRIIERELRARRKLNVVPPEEWRRRVDALPEYLQKPTASIIYWDYFEFDGPVSERWPHLDDLLTQPIGDPPLEAIEAALIACGYPPFTAIIRIEGDASQRGRGRGWRHEMIKEAA